MSPELLAELARTAAEVERAGPGQRTVTGHPAADGAGYDCNCGACLALPARRREEAQADYEHALEVRRAAGRREQRTLRWMRDGRGTAAEHETAKLERRAATARVSEARRRLRAVVSVRREGR